MSLVGIHVADVLDIQSEENKEIKFFQVFVSATTDYKRQEYIDAFQYIKDRNIYLVVHASYSINLAKRWKESDSWIQQFITEIQIASKIGAFGIIVHTGKKLELSNGEALNNMYSSLLYIHKETLQQKNIKILIETPSGQGSETLVKIDEFCRFLNKFYAHPDHTVRERFGVCIDTCHIFAAGHDIRSDKDMNEFFGTVDKMIGIDKIKVCHLNDSKKGLGSNVDRHANIGDGEIGREPIMKIVKFMKGLRVPLVLETPSDAIENDYEEIKSI